jgi:hypothetical protein
MLCFVPALGHSPDLFPVRFDNCHVWRAHAVIIRQRRLDTLGYEENLSMIEEIPLQEKERRLNEALDRLQRTVDAAGGVPDETFAEFLAAADDYRKDLRHKASLAV